MRAQDLRTLAQPICRAAASIDDQVRICRERIEREGWTYLHAYC